MSRYQRRKISKLVSISTEKLEIDYLSQPFDFLENLSAFTVSSM